MPKYYAITDKGVAAASSLKKLNQSLNAELEEEELIPIGPDRLIKLTKADIEFVQDKKRMSLIPIKNLYKKSNTVTLMLTVILIMQFILMVKK